MSGRTANDKRRILALAEAILDNPPEDLRDLIQVNDLIANVERVPDAEQTGVIARIEISPAVASEESPTQTANSEVGVIGEVLFTDANGNTSAQKVRVRYSGVGMYVTDLPAAVQGPIWMQVNDGKRGYRVPLEPRAGGEEWDVPLLGGLSPLELRNCIRRCMVGLTQLADPIDVDRIPDRSVRS